MTDNKKIAEQVLRAVGGAANLKDATHCMTRLRLYLKDDSVPKDDEVKKISGVLGVVRGGQQYQIIIGTNVPKVFWITRKKSSCSPISVSVRSLSTPTPRRTISLIWQAVLQQTAPASVWRWTAQTAALPPQQRNSLHVWVQKYICSAHLRTAQTSTKTAALPIWKTSWHM